MSDLVARAILLATFVVLAISKGASILTELRHFDGRDFVPAALTAASHVASLAFVLFIIAVTFVRAKAVASARGLVPRIGAIMGTYLTFLLPLLPLAELPRSVQIASLLLVFGGLSLSLWAIHWLGRSLSVTAQARHLITGGPYAIVRHPLYLTEEIAIIGVILSHLCIEAVLIGVLHWAFQLRRMANEENVLRAAFPEYAAYAARTPRLNPALGLRKRALRVAPIN